MKNFQKLYLLFVCLISVLVACAADSEHEKLNIIDAWVLEKVVYDDNSTKVFPGKDNYVEIHSDYILEIIAGYGERRYPYTKIDNILKLTSGNETISWAITRYNQHNLQIKTPVGLYVLKRASK